MDRLKWGKLVGREVVPVTLEEMTDFYFMEESRRIAETRVSKDIKVSTVFLGLDHSWFEDPAPLWFETMIFGGKHDGSQWRWTTYSQAEKGHQLAVELATHSVKLRSPLRYLGSRILQKLKKIFKR